MERLLMWFCSWAYLLQGMIGVLSLDYYNPKLGLAMAKKLAKYRWAKK